MCLLLRFVFMFRNSDVDLWWMDVKVEILDVSVAFSVVVMNLCTRAEYRC